MDYRYLGQISCEALRSLDHAQCKELCAEIRQEMIRTVTNNGGHLASNLGIVELTLALHRVFHSPKDRFIFDVSHQCYVHKLLTDRHQAFETLRKPGGLSGFQKRSESEHDPFGGGHASTSLSAALGFAEADRILGRDSFTVAIAGDGAFTGGMIHEAMNNCRDGLRLIFILNENEMSISPNIGGFARYIANVRSNEGYFGTKRKVRKALSAIPGIGKGMVRFVSRQKSRLKNLLYSTNYFENLGFYYLGPVDGHDIARLERLLSEAKESDRPTILHIKTQKGRGFFPAETDPGAFHGVAAEGSKKLISFSEHFGQTLCELAEQDASLCAITAAMADGTGLVPFSKAHPDRFFDVGIAEEHAMTYAAGLSAAGAHPVFAVYSTFLQRCYDQLIHDVALQKLPITVAVDRAGLAVGDGPTHHGIFDVSMALSLNGSQIWAPLSFAALDEILPVAVTSADCDFVRYRSGTELSDADLRLPYISKEHMIRGTDDAEAALIVLTYGQITEEALSARKIAADKGIHLRVIALEKLRPDAMMMQTLISLIPPRAKVVFLEEGVRNGGAGMQYASLLAEHGIRCKVLAISDPTVAFRADESPYKTMGISSDNVLQAFEIEI